jgi:putative endonuclease
MNCVYILYSKTLDSYYVGETVDFEDRLNQHNIGFYHSGFTKQAKDWGLFHKIDYYSRSHARKIEAHIKRMKSKTYIQNLKKFPEITEKLKNKYY